MPRTTRPPRRAGRPRVGAGSDSRESLLDAAVILFAAQGIAATSIAQVAADAGVTPAMVHYHFRSRSRLLDAIAEERLLRAIMEVWAPVSDNVGDVAAIVRGLVERIVRVTESRPWLPSLWLREIVSEGGELRDRVLRSIPFTHVQRFIEAVATAQRRGLTDPRLDPRLMFVSVIGVTLLPLATMNIWQQLPLMRGITRRQLAQHAEALLLHGLSEPRVRIERIRPVKE